MLTGQDKQTVLIKSIPQLQESFKAFVSENPQVLVLALDELTAWSLRQNNYTVQLLQPVSKIEGHFKIHQELENYFNQFLSQEPRKSLSPDLELLKNHLCWEIQNEYTLLKDITAWVKQNRVGRIFFEKVDSSEQRRFAPNLNDLAQAWFKQKGVCFDIFPTA